MSGRLFLLSHIAQVYDLDTIKAKYEHIELTEFEQRYLNLLISYNQEIFSNEWNSSEHQYLEAIFKKMKYYFIVKYSKEYNDYDLIRQYEAYITSESSLHSVVEILDYA